jgi:hypothetical protein
VWGGAVSVGKPVDGEPGRYVYEFRAVEGGLEAGSQDPFEDEDDMDDPDDIAKDEAERQSATRALEDKLDALAASLKQMSEARSVPSI